MTPTELVIAVARATGESPRTIRRLGFSLCDPGPAGPGPEDPAPVLDGLPCGRPVPDPVPPREATPGRAAGGQCDLDFPSDPGDVDAARSPAAAGGRGGPGGVNRP